MICLTNTEQETRVLGSYMKKLLLFAFLLIFILGCTSTTPPQGPTQQVLLFDLNPYNCTNSVEGRFYANNASHSMCYCNSTDWVNLFNSSLIC